MHHKVTVKSHAKINISLRVIGKRDDGYHNISTFFQKIDLSDILHIKISECSENSINIITLDPNIPTDNKNLIYKAAEYFLESTQTNLNITVNLIKNIPIGAGLGGGSSNAASMLLSLNKSLGDPLKEEELLKIGLRIGSDVPFFIKDTGACIGSGRGEILKNTNSLKGYFILIYPGFGISTKWAYENLHLTNDNHTDILSDFNNGFWINDLEKGVTEKYPIIKEIKEILIKFGAEKSMMSGSGSTVFGYYEDRKKALESLEKIKKELSKNRDYNCKIFLTKSMD